MFNVFAKSQISKQRKLFDSGFQEQRGLDQIANLPRQLFYVLQGKVGK